MVEDAHGRLPRRTCGMIVNIDTFVCERCVGRVDGDGPQAGGRGRAHTACRGLRAVPVPNSYTRTLL